MLSHMQLTGVFSPNGDGRRDVERIAFHVKLNATASVDVVDVDGVRVRRLAGALRIRRGRVAHVQWNGLQDDGTHAPDGRYRLRLLLRDQGRAILAGHSFVLDTRPPRPLVYVARRTTVVAPGRPVRFHAYRTGRAVAPSFTVLRTDVSPPRAVRHLAGVAGRRAFAWDGRDDAGRPAAPGTYLIQVTAEDRAGNRATSPRTPLSPGEIRGRPGVTVRALTIQPPVRPVRSGGLVAFDVFTGGRPYRWRLRRLGARRAILAPRRPHGPGTLLLRAPKAGTGLYLLEVRSRGMRARVPLAVQGAAHARMLVVLPMLTWLGEDPVADGAHPDGLPDTLAAGDAVPYPRPFAFPGGLPPGFGAGVAALLVWLDRHHVAYDLTTDLALALSSRDPVAGQRRGLLFPGAPRYVDPGLARRLRRYVSDGGRVALFGPGALTAGVTVGNLRLTGPTPAGPTDALGARLAPLRRLTVPPGGVLPPLTVLREDVPLGLLEGFSGQLTGFERVEELVSPGAGAKLATGVGEAVSPAELALDEQRNRTPRPERPSFSAVRQGRGLVIRVGLPAWNRRLVAGDPAVQQLTFNLVDLLRGRRPRPRTAG